MIFYGQDLQSYPGFNLDRINRIKQILIFHFQFPEETEKTQSPPANKKGIYIILLWGIKLSSNETNKYD